MKILHVIYRDEKSKFVKLATSFINAYFEKEEHDIFYLNYYGESSLVSSDIDNNQMEIFVKNRYDWISMKKVLCEAKQYDFVMFHSLFPFFLLKTMLTFDKKLLKKMIWVEFGGDLYPTDDKSIISKIYYGLNKYIAKDLLAFVGIFPPDCDYFKEKFPGSNAKIYYAPYCGDKVPEEFKHYDSSSRLQETLRKKESIYILIGHSAVKRMGHIEVLDYLKRFSERDIKLLIPLSYGDKKYADEVQKYAEDIFKEKAICLRSFMEKEEYFNLLRRVDIAVFNAYEQLGLGNINRMIFWNAKIYMPENSAMYKYYRSKYIPINKISDLSKDSFEELISLPVYENRQRCTEFIKSFGDMESFRVEPWKKIYDELRSISVNDTV